MIVKSGFISWYRHHNLRKEYADHLLIFQQMAIAVSIYHYSDASKNPNFGIGAVFKQPWLIQKWPENFIVNCDPSIEFLELYGLVAVLYTWKNVNELKDGRVNIFCDNQSVQHMVNNLASSCMQCMKLIRFSTLLCVRNNIRIFMKYVKSQDNFLADSLSRMDLQHFRRMTSAEINTLPDAIPEFLHPVSKVWSFTFTELLHEFYR